MQHEGWSCVSGQISSSMENPHLKPPLHNLIQCIGPVVRVSGASQEAASLAPYNQRKWLSAGKPREDRKPETTTEAQGTNNKKCILGGKKEKKEKRKKIPTKTPHKLLIKRRF